MSLALRWYVGTHPVHAAHCLIDRDDKAASQQTTTRLSHHLTWQRTRGSSTARLGAPTCAGSYTACASDDVLGSLVDEGSAASSDDGEPCSVALRFTAE